MSFYAKAAISLAASLHAHASGTKSESPEAKFDGIIIFASFFRCTSSAQFFTRGYTTMCKILDISETYRISIDRKLWLSVSFGEKYHFSLNIVFLNLSFHENHCKDLNVRTIPYLSSVRSNLDIFHTHCSTLFKKLASPRNPEKSHKIPKNHQSPPPLYIRLRNKSFA